MKFRFEFDDCEYCPLTTSEYEPLCRCDEVLFCKGVMNNRPIDCPLVEVNDEKEI